MTQDIILNVDYYTGLSCNAIEHMNLFIYLFSLYTNILGVEFLALPFMTFLS